jgi:hypothetical protein
MIMTYYGRKQSRSNVTYHPVIFLGCLRKLKETSVEIAPPYVDFRTQATPRTKLECYALGL